MTKEVIPDRLVDTTTVYKKHTWYTHLICIFLRLIFGVFLILKDDISNELTSILVILMLIIVILFSVKFIKNSNTWKVYLRTILAYSISALLLYTNNNKESGLVVISDALMAVQSRHTASLFTH